MGYAAYFRLTNGFEKSLYMTAADLLEHGKKYSKPFARNDSAWKTDFDAMARKTVLKALLSKWGPLSIQLQKALAADAPPDDEPANGNGHGPATAAMLYGEDEPAVETAESKPDNAALDAEIVASEAKAGKGK